MGILLLEHRKMKLIQAYVSWKRSIKALRAFQQLGILKDLKAAMKTCWAWNWEKETREVRLFPSVSYLEQRTGNVSALERNHFIRGQNSRCKGRESISFILDSQWDQLLVNLLNENQNYNEPLTWEASGLSYQVRNIKI